MSGARGNGLARRLEEAGVAAAGLVTVALTHGRRWLLRESRSSGPARRARQATAVT
ncbi:site-specific tyrosine recombinase XerD, partial [Frankia sp. CNm7]|nr:site-specific tyrosine recombinase XerD [Frankia nepalensis]